MAPKAVLVGMPGSGKTTIGRRLAKALDVTSLDTDAAIVESTGRLIADIFRDHGEAEFRRIEESVVLAALRDHDGIVSLGGGAVTIPAVASALAEQLVVYLEISAAEGLRRTGRGEARPLLAGDDRESTYRKLLADRHPLYREVATWRINTGRRYPGAVVRHIAARLEGPAPRRRRSPWRRGEAAGRPAGAAPSPASMPIRRHRAP